MPWGTDRKALQGIAFRAQNQRGWWFLGLPPPRPSPGKKRFSVRHELSREPCLWAVGRITEQGLGWKNHKVVNNVPSTGGGKGSRQGLPNPIPTGPCRGVGQARGGREHQGARAQAGAPGPVRKPGSRCSPQTSGSCHARRWARVLDSLESQGRGV